MAEEEKVPGHKTNVVTTQTVASLENEAEAAKKEREVFYGEHREVIKTYRRLKEKEYDANEKLRWARRRNHIQLLREAGWQEFEVNLLIDKGSGEEFLFHPKIDLSKWEDVWYDRDLFNEFYKWLKSLREGEDYIPLP